MESLRLKKKTNAVVRSISVYPDTINKIEKYIEKESIGSFSEAVEKLILKGLGK